MHGFKLFDFRDPEELLLDPLSKAAHTLAPLALGGTAARVTAVALAVAPDGRFVACCAAGVFAGRVAGAASGDGARFSDSNRARTKASGVVFGQDAFFTAGAGCATGG